MRSCYQQLLDATIGHLEQLKARGERLIEISPGSLRVLSQLRTNPIAAPRPSPSRSAPPQGTLSEMAKPVSAPRPTEPSVLVPASIKTSVSAEEKSRALAELRERALVCTRCPHLVNSR